MAIPFEIQFADTDNVDKNARPKNRLIKGAQIAKFVKSVSTRAKTIITKAFKHYSNSEERVARYLPVVEEIYMVSFLHTVIICKCSLVMDSPIIVLRIT